MNFTWKEEKKERMDKRERRRKEEDVVLVWGVDVCGYAHVWCMESALKL